MANKDDGNDDDKIGNLKDVGTTKNLFHEETNRKSNTIASIFSSGRKNVMVIIVSYYLLYCVFFRVTACIHSSSTVLVYLVLVIHFPIPMHFIIIIRKTFRVLPYVLLVCVCFCLLLELRVLMCDNPIGP